jgi:hypothetical protein
MMWAAGAVAAMSSITFPAVSALVSHSADPDKQGKTFPLLPFTVCNLSIHPVLYGITFPPPLPFFESE